MAALLLGVPAELLSRISGDGTDDGVYKTSGTRMTRHNIIISPNMFDKEYRNEDAGLTLLSDDPVDGTLGVLLGLGSLDLGFSLVVPLLSVLGQDARLGGSSDGLELWT